MQHLRGTVD